MRVRPLISAAVVLALTGCSSTADATDWASDVCVALDPWRTEIDTLAAETGEAISDTSTPQETKDQLLALLNGAAQSTESALRDVQRAGIPDVDNGESIAERFADSLRATRDAYREAHDALRALSAGNADFYEEVANVMADLNTAYAAIPQVAELNSAELEAAFADVDACR
ncbi:hypothetical protein [Stackebrandtia soli]|uniref:hypothetical protein n=1 Tax=Stackebrandtia soli TaxID=1892856 RepID=UPI0039E7406E